MLVFVITAVVAFLAICWLWWFEYNHLEAWFEKGYNAHAEWQSRALYYMMDHDQCDAACAFIDAMMAVSPDKSNAKLPTV